MTDHSRSTAGTTTDDPFSMQHGSDVCFWCKQRKSPADILECEKRGPGRSGCQK